MQLKYLLDSNSPRPLIDLHYVGTHAILQELLVLRIALAVQIVRDLEGFLNGPQSDVALLRELSCLLPLLTLLYVESTIQMRIVLL